MEKEKFLGKYSYTALAFFGMAAFAIAFFASPAAFAVTAPTTGSFAYDIYDIGINDILKGPIGFVGGVGAIVFGAVEAIRGRALNSIAPVLGGAALIKADAITSSLGLNIL